MILISKKRIKIVIACLLISIFAFSFKIADTPTNKNEQGNNIIQTTSTPVSGKTIVLDAGHGIPDERSTIKQWNDRSRN